MGYEAPIDFIDSNQGRWRGGHRPQLVDLSTIFEHVVELSEEELAHGDELAVEAWRAALPFSAELVRLMGRRTAHLHVRDGPQTRDLILKLVPHGGSTIGWLKSQFERSRAHRAYLWAHRLRAHGIETPRPLGYVEHTKSPYGRASFAAFELIDAPTLVELRDAGVLESAMSPAEKRALIDRVASFIRGMHEVGIFHADLHGGNLIVDQDRILVIDLESIRKLPRPERIVLKTLSRLNHEFWDPALLSRTDRLRFLRAYLLHSADKESRRRKLWSEVLKRTEERLAAD